MSVVVVPKIACPSDCPDDINDSVPAQAGHAGEFLSTDGSVVSWQPVSGGTPTGDVNTLAYFNASGNLDSDTKLKFNVTPYAISYGPETSTGVNVATGSGSLAHANNTGTGNVTASGSGSSAHGFTSGAGTITASNNGSEAAGNAAGGAITAGTGNGSKAHGTSLGTLSALGTGSVARGNVTTSGSTVTATASGSMAAGFVDASTTITANGAGSIASGAVTTSGSITAGSGSGALAMGGFTAGTVVASGNGAHAHGSGITSGVLTASGTASHVNARTANSGAATASANGTHAMGDVDSGSVQATASAAMAVGRTLTSGTVLSSGIASQTHGEANNSGAVTASGIGSTSTGFADGASSVILSNNRGATASGNSEGGSTLQATQHGSFSHGSATGTGSLSSSGVGAEAAGTANLGSISSSGIGSKAFGNSDGASSQIASSGIGSLSFGVTGTGGIISSVSNASITFGSAVGAGSLITATTGNKGALVFGDTDNGGIIRTQSGSSLVYGFSQTAARTIDGNGVGVYAAGTTHIGSVQVYGLAGFGHGSDIDAPAWYSQTLGIGHANDSYGAMFIGQYSTSPGYTEASYVTTDPVFVIGNGASSGSRHDAVRILKNGQFEIYGPLRLQGSTAGYTGFQSAATGGSTTFTVPSADGTNGQVLTTNGSGILSFSTPTASASLSGLTAATGTNTIENVNFAQAWEWDSLTTQTALQLSSSSMTSGTIFKVVDTRNNADNTGNIVRIESSGGTASTAKLLSLSHDGNNASVRGISLTMSGASGAYAAIDIDSASQGAAFGIRTVMSDQSVNGPPKAIFAQVDSQNSGAIAGSFLMSGIGGAAAGTAVKAEVAGAGYSGWFLSDGSTGSKNLIKVDNSSTATTDNGAAITFFNNRTTGGTTHVASVEGRITDITNGTYKGALIFQTANAATPVEQMRIKHDGSLLFPFTNTTAGTTGNQTINKISGTVNFATAASSVTVTNNLVTANSLVFAVVRTNDATAVIKNVVPGSGSFVITLNAAATAETSVGFWVINQ